MGIFIALELTFICLVLKLRVAQYSAKGGRKVADKHIKTGPALFRGAMFALFTFNLGLLMLTWVINPISSLPIWGDRLLGVALVICLSMIFRRSLQENQIPAIPELVWPAIWAVITYAVSGWLVGPNRHSQLLETLGVTGNFWLVLLATVAIWAISVNGFTFIVKSILAWEAATRKSSGGAVFLLWILAMVFSWLGTVIFPQLAFNWLALAIYWLATILLSGSFRDLFKESTG